MGWIQSSDYLQYWKGGRLIQHKWQHLGPPESVPVNYIWHKTHISMDNEHGWVGEGEILSNFGGTWDLQWTCRWFLRAGVRKAKTDKDQFKKEEEQGGGGRMEQTNRHIEIYWRGNGLFREKERSLLLSRVFFSSQLARHGRDVVQRGSSSSIRAAAPWHLTLQNCNRGKFSALDTPTFTFPMQDT